MAADRRAEERRRGTLPSWSYVPFLKGKQGERLALRGLDAVTRGAITPAFQVLPGRTEDRLERELRQLAQGWRAAPVLIDTSWLDPAATSDHPLRFIGTAGRKLGLEVVPVVGPASDNGMRQAARAVAAQHGSGAAIRLAPASWLLGLAQPVIDALLIDLDLAPREVDLLFDAGAIANQAGLDLYSALRDQSLPALPYLHDWRRVVILAGSFPADLRAIPTGSIRRLPRLEWTFWTGTSGSGAHLAYGDYAVAHPETMDELENPRAIPLYPQIRYTSKSEYVITKGRDLRRYSDNELYAACRRVEQLPDFAGPSFSTADRWIAERAAGSGSVGNYSTWRRIATIHHITQVVSQLASPGGP